MAKAWSCLSSLREVHLGSSESGWADCVVMFALDLGGNMGVTGGAGVAIVPLCLLLVTCEARTLGKGVDKTSRLVFVVKILLLSTFTRI